MKSPWPPASELSFFDTRIARRPLPPLPAPRAQRPLGKQCFFPSFDRGRDQIYWVFLERSREPSQLGYFPGVGLVCTKKGQHLGGLCLWSITGSIRSWQTTLLGSWESQSSGPVKPIRRGQVSQCILGLGNSLPWGAAEAKRHSKTQDPDWKQRWRAERPRAVTVPINPSATGGHKLVLSSCTSLWLLGLGEGSKFLPEVSEQLRGCSDGTWTRWDPGSDQLW